MLSKEKSAFACRFNLVTETARGLIHACLTKLQVLFITRVPSFGCIVAVLT